MVPKVPIWTPLTMVHKCAMPLPVSASSCATFSMSIIFFFSIKPRRQLSSVAQSCPTPCDSMNCSTPGLTVYHQLMEFTQTHVHRVGDAIQPSHPLCPLLLLPPIPPSIRVFSNDSVLHIRWPKYWSFSFSISPSSEHPGFISFGMDWLDLLAVQGTLKSLLQHHSAKASIFRRSAFFTVQLSHQHMTTGKEAEAFAFVFSSCLESSSSFFAKASISISPPQRSYQTILT